MKPDWMNAMKVNKRERQMKNQDSASRPAAIGPDPPTV
jgi:hypothetical protein